MIKKIGLGLLSVLLLLVAVLAVNTLRKGSRQVEVAPLAAIPVDEAAVAERLAEAVRFKTISTHADHKANQDQDWVRQMRDRAYVEDRAEDR